MHSQLGFYFNLRLVAVPCRNTILLNNNRADYEMMEGDWNKSLNTVNCNKVAYVSNLKIGIRDHRWLKMEPAVSEIDDNVDPLHSRWSASQNFT